MTNIYFIKNKNNDIKIGRSENIEKRLKELQTGNSNNLKLLYFIKDVPESFEKHLHDICVRFKIQGEWFQEKCIEFLLKHPFYKKNMKQYRKKR